MQDGGPYQKYCLKVHAYRLSKPNLPFKSTCSKVQHDSFEYILPKRCSDQINTLCRHTPQQSYLVITAATNRWLAGSSDLSDGLQIISYEFERCIAICKEGLHLCIDLKYLHDYGSSNKKSWNVFHFSYDYDITIFPRYCPLKGNNTVLIHGAIPCVFWTLMLNRRTVYT